MASSAPDSSEAGFKDRFFDYFKQEAATLHEQIDRLSEIPAAGSERVDAVNHSLAAIAKLQREVSDASSQLPAHNQKSYSEQIKQLNEKLQKARESFAPRQKFSFKNARKVARSSSLMPAADSASQLPPSSSPQTATTSHEEAIEEIPDDSGNYNVTLREITTRDIRSPSFTQATHVNLYDHQSMHIVLPISARFAMTTGSIRDIRHCIVDISISWKDEALKNTHFATMNMINIVDSLILTGSVKGATHVTGMRNCVIVTSTGQLRMHQCEDVDVYLRCSSEPIIEHCKGMRFAPLPEHFTSNSPPLSTPNRWNHVQDFQWIKAEHSPNWSILPESERVSEEIWRDVVPGSPKIGLGEIMKVVRAGGLGVSK